MYFIFQLRYQIDAYLGE